MKFLNPLEHLQRKVWRVLSGTALIAAVASPAWAAPSNLALGKPTQTSSTSEWSHPNDGQGAVDGIINGSFGFHTNAGPNQWWQVDLGAVANLSEVVVFNRLDCCAERAQQLDALVSDDGMRWTPVFANASGPFGGRDGRALRIRLSNRARFVRLQLRDNNPLHLDEVQVIGEFGPTLADSNQCGAWMEQYRLAPYRSWGSTPGKVQGIWDASDCNHKVCQYMQDRYGVIPHTTWGALPGHLQKVWDTPEVNCNVHVSNRGQAAPPPAPPQAAPPPREPPPPAPMDNRSELLRTSKPVYASGEPIELQWRDLPSGEQFAWVNITPRSASDDDWGDWTYTRGQAKGSFALPRGLKPGEYEARAFRASSAPVADRLPFSVR